MSSLDVDVPPKVSEINGAGYAQKSVGGPFKSFVHLLIVTFSSPWWINILMISDVKIPVQTI